MGTGEPSVEILRIWEHGCGGTFFFGLPGNLGTGELGWGFWEYGCSGFLDPYIARFPMQ